MSSALSPSAVADLRDRLTGHAFLPGDPGYPAETAPWDASIRIASPVTVIPASTADITTAAQWARDHGLHVGVLNTGHGILDDQHDSLLLHTASLGGVRFDPASRTAMVQPGARWSDVQALANPHGQTGVCGAMPGVGVVGYTLGGGLSPIGRSFGMGADRVRRIRVLDADYTPIDVTAESDPELFWALRGGGGFGLVTELEFETVEVPALFGGGVYFSGAHAEQVLTAYREWVGILDERTSTSIALLHLPPVPALPDLLRGQYVVHLRIAHIDPTVSSLEAAGRAILAPMLAAAPVLNDYTHRMTPDQLPDIHRDPVAPMPVAYRGGGRHDLDDDAIASIVASASPQDGLAPAAIEIRHLGGAMSRPTAAPNSATARSTTFHVWASSPVDLADPQRYRRLVDDVVERAGATSDGAQLSFYGPDPEPGAFQRLWGESDAGRLRAVVQRIDPDGRIRTGRSYSAAVESAGAR
ncbi:FAD-binding oxidoreductase [Leifsonia shinshuensis]|uniref:FAD-binding oxidoreductase n=1 Tax=Leifsonia shinshuensis TaxID=150026 RepID=UPI002865AE88|nr:FAD-binding oxidoreductase [Leifsonia shinshuensis]MDR6972703.1 FAD/FMN-containing dehydrogenase [Leifsonia shinshuensis]